MINNTPRKILKFQTPLDVYQKSKMSSRESRMKLARPAVEAKQDYQKGTNVAFHY